jgi:PIN domain nuclease of toxin-antitoxin system
VRAVADTHAAIWYLWKPENLSPRAAAIIDESAEQGERVGVSAITLCEIVYLAEKGRIRSDAADLFLESILAPDGVFEEIPLDSAVAMLLPSVSHSQVPDMPDRIIAATAHSCGVSLITKDRKIQQADIDTIW